MRRKLYSLTAAVLLPAAALLAQDATSGCPKTENKEAQKLFDKAQDKKKNSFDERLELMGKAVEADPDWADANYELAKMLLIRAQANQTPRTPAMPFLKKAIELCPEVHSEPYYIISEENFNNENYADALTYAEKFLKFDSDDKKKFSKDYDTQLENAKNIKKWSKFYIEIKGHPKPFDPHVVTGISSDKDEYLAYISPDGSQCLFTRAQMASTKNGISGMQTDRIEEIFSESNLQKNGTFDEGHRMLEPFNKLPNEGSATLTIDNKHMYYTVGKPNAAGDPSADIYYSDFVNGDWTEVKPVDKINDPDWWDGQPTISSDGKTLYFASNRPGGFGGVDLYVTRKQADGSWSTPVNLGPTINTEKDEKSPFIHTDSETLYFSSNGLPGLDGQDIFFVKKDATGKWQEPKNIGMPINTEGDDLGFFVSTDGHYGYFSSNRSLAGARGGWDLYSFDLYAEARPVEMSIYKGEVKDSSGGHYTGPLIVEVKNTTTKEKTEAVVDTTTGQIAAALRVDKKDNYLLTVKKDGAAFSSQLITADQLADKTKPVTIDLQVAPLQVGSAYTLQNINFSSGSSELRTESKDVIEAFADYLKANKNIKIEIHGHTDDVGDPVRNKALSLERAFVVRELLEDLGVDKSQILDHKGFGQEKPLVANINETNRAKNRRTEFVIMEK